VNPYRITKSTWIRKYSILYVKVTKIFAPSPEVTNHQPTSVTLQNVVGYHSFNVKKPNPKQQTSKIRTSQFYLSAAHRASAQCPAPYVVDKIPRNLTACVA
jgi:hypothetical protein